MFEKKLRRRVEQRTAGQFGAAGDADQRAVEQRLDDPARVHAAHRFHVRARQRLAVGDDGERFQRGRAQPRRAALGKELPHPRRAGRRAVELPTGGGFGQFEGCAALPVAGGQRRQRIETSWSRLRASVAASGSSVNSPADFRAARISATVRGLGKRTAGLRAPAATSSDRRGKQLGVKERPTIKQRCLPASDGFTPSLRP